MRKKPPKVYHAYRGKNRWKKALVTVLIVLALLAAGFAVCYFGHFFR